MSLGTILLIILVIVLLGGFSGLGGGPFYGTGYYGGGGLGLILVIVRSWFCSASFDRAKIISRMHAPGETTRYCAGAAAARS
jgi:Protein of unknown function (DUF3309)